jgi:hypothetical protein
MNLFAHCSAFNMGDMVVEIFLLSRETVEIGGGGGGGGTPAHTHAHKHITVGNKNYDRDTAGLIRCGQPEFFMFSASLLPMYVNYFV